MTLLLSPTTALQEDLPVAARETVLAVLEAALSAVGVQALQAVISATQIIGP